MVKALFELKVDDLWWINAEEEEKDLCAHGAPRVRIGNEIILSSLPGVSYTVSSTALFALRTLERDHNSSNKVGDHLVPHCGSTFHYEMGMKEVAIIGCNIGIDWEVIHESNKVKLTSENSCSVSIPWIEYRDIVTNFSQQVLNFYDKSKTKVMPIDEHDIRGYLQFREEWHALHFKYQKHEKQ